MTAERHTVNDPESGAVPPYKDDEGKILGKFQDEKALVEAYQELERKLGGGGDPPPPQDPPAPAEPPKDESKTPPKDESKPGPKQRELSIDDMKSIEDNPPPVFADASTEYAEKGELSPETYEKLAKAGATKEMVDTFIAGREALWERQESEALELVGGRDEAEKMVEWARQNLKPEEIKAYNDAVNGTDFNLAKLHIRDMVTRFRESGASQFSVGPEGTPGGGRPRGFQSQAQIREAMRDPRYNTDPAYRAEVIERVRISDPGIQ